MAIKDGGPAFPNITPDMNVDGGPGMSLRDYFAGQALAFMQSRENVVAILDAARAQQREEESEATFARVAYQIADAMLKAREERQ